MKIAFGMRVLGFILAVVLVVRAQKDLIEDLFRESRVEPVLQLLEVCTAAKNGGEVNGYRRTISDLMKSVATDSDVIDGEDRFYPERADDLFEEICSDLEVYLAHVAAHLAQTDRYNEHHEGAMNKVGAHSIIRTCMAQNENGEQPIKRGLHRLLQGLGLKNLRPEEAREHAESINKMFNKMCEEIVNVLKLVPGTTLPTPVDGSWSSWKSGRCSVTCGTGTYRKTRTCTNPSPRYGGKSCSGSATTTAVCRRSPCKVDGSWSSWKSGRCSVTCGTGTYRKTRTCTNPSPRYGGKSCSGSASVTAVCRRSPCTKEIVYTISSTMQDPFWLVKDGVKIQNTATTRGINIYTLSNIDGHLMRYKAFDTFDSSLHSDITNHLAGIKEGSYVIFITMDEATRKLSANTKNYLKNIYKSSRISSLAFRGGWSMVVQKGGPKYCERAVGKWGKGIVQDRLDVTVKLLVGGGKAAMEKGECKAVTP